jgi:predicted SnoaL-like aldol condensation-catalyzing enzyme
MFPRNWRVHRSNNGQQMQLAKNVIDIGVSTNNLEPMLRFWQQDVGLRFDYVLPVRRGSSASDVLHQPAIVSKRRNAMATPTKPSSEDRRVQTVLDAFDTLFNKRDYASAERFWSPRYIQHSAHIPPGRDGLFGLVKTLPATLRYENHIAAATGDFVILHGRFSGIGQPAAWVVADIVRMEDGVLAEHWDVIQDEVTREQSRSGLPMFGDKFPA